MAKRRTVIRNSVVITIDKELGDFEQADLLIEDDLIAAVGPNLPIEDALSPPSTTRAGLLLWPRGRATLIQFLSPASWSSSTANCSTATLIEFTGWPSRREIIYSPPRAFLQAQRR